ncbi:hypothetical protein ACIBSR_03305 [Streptomyces sp. NPDC049936]|uniref:hypothetical protein n=1 Tax=Streptomyces sp. NPDC049936 TaxID=3365599 RepID=UPI0037883CEA
MRPETLAGLFGLGGTVVGVGGTVLAGWFQQRSQVRTAREEREEARASEAESRGREVARKALSELYDLRRQALTWKTGMSSQERDEWVATAHARADEAELNAALIPQGDVLRVRLRDALSAARGLFSEGADDDYQVYPTEFAVDHCIALLSAYMRGDPALPRQTRREERTMLEREMRENP